MPGIHRRAAADQSPRSGAPETERSSSQGHDRDGQRDAPSDRPPEEAVLAPDDPRKPQSPTDLRGRSWWDAVKRSVAEFRDDNCTDWAAALTYYGVLSLFPAAIVFVALIGLFGQGADTVKTLTDIIKQLGPESAANALSGPIEQVVNQRAAAGSLFGLGLLLALWSASGYIGAFIRATNAIYEVREGRPFYLLRPIQILITIAMTLLLALVTVGLIVSGPVARAIGDVIGLGSTAVTLWQWLKWPVIVIIVSFTISALYHIAPNVKQPRFRWFTPGGLVALLVWAVASVLFAFYVSQFGSYNKTYGSLGAVIVFLVWLWVTNNAILFGAELNAELERERELAAGQPAEEEIQLPPRRAPKD